MNKKCIRHRVVFVFKTLRFWDISEFYMSHVLLSFQDYDEIEGRSNNMGIIWGKYHLHMKNGETYILDYKCNNFEEMMDKWIANDHKLKTIFCGIFIPVIGWLGYEGVKNIFK